MKSSVFAILVMCLLTGCSKDNDSDDNEPPVITFITPLHNQVFSAGQDVSITATLTDNKRISEVHVHITNNTTGTLLVDIHRTPAAATDALNETFTVGSGIEYKITVLVKDNSANESTKYVLISTP